MKLAKNLEISNSLMVNMQMQMDSFATRLENMEKNQEKVTNQNDRNHCFTHIERPST